ncbi:MAG TPA: NHLP family bacteriocin export ABC transporter peptidase/permease/ATPase subunit [Vicinamibacterales bacterium]|nr:NHLP family bacteriocin export ABC transporter peptidase/permease/ATPase subunit [Vicinamibacterales bacterium]
MSETPESVVPTAEAEAPKALPKPPNRRVRTPTILQMEAVECGAAALAMILAKYGRWVPLEELRHECGVSRDGSKANNVLKAARKYGLDAKGFKYDALEKLYTLKLPVILFWNFNHFIVLEGFKGGRVFLNDPAQGPRVVTMTELDGSYSGVVLTFQPAKEFAKGGQPPNMLPALRRRLRGSEWALIFTILCGLFLVVPGLAIPAFTQVFIDDYLVKGQKWLLGPLLWMMGGAVLVQGALKWLQEYYLLRLETRLALSTSSDFFNHIIRLPASYFGQRFAGEIGSRVQINDKVANIVSGKLAMTVIDSVMTLFYGALMCVYDVKLTLIVAGLAMVNVGSVRLAARLRTDSSRRMMQDAGKLMGVSMNGLQMIETIKATGSEPEFFARWSGYFAKVVNTTQFLQVLGQISGAVPAFVQTLSTAAVLVLGGLKVMDGQMTMGMLVAYQTLLSSFTRPIVTFVQFGSTLQELTADMNRLDDVTRFPIDIQYRQDPKEVRHDPTKIKLSGHVELRDITFGYSPLEPPLVEDFNLVVKPGRRVALVGSSGSGKSTVAKLASGLFQPWKGEVLFDGVPRQQLPRELIANSLGVVDQDLFLFGGSVAENVTMWDSTIAPQRVRTAGRDAAIDEVIEAREGGYQSRVQEGGGNFSGGQCQRLEITRSLVGEPTIMILDEATSALDPTTEAHIDDSMRRRGCTCIIIAHRLSTIRDADEIIVMDRGKIVQRGTHEGMKDAEGPYKYLMGH